MNRILFPFFLLALSPQLSCNHPRVISTPSTNPLTQPPTALQFVPVQKQAGVDFSLGSHGKTPLSILETAGGGCAFLDFDSDGWPDILLVGPHNAALYRNLGNGAFKNVTGHSGIDPRRHWMGCASGDYDGDGKPDIFLTGYRCHALLHNEGGGKFLDVTQTSGIDGLEWSLSAAFEDFDGDGRLDLFVSQYVVFDSSTPALCAVGTTTSACGPEVYKPLSGKMFTNVNGFQFRPVYWEDSGKTWGALASDLLQSGHPSLYLANDMVPCDLWKRRAGRWTNSGPISGVAYDGQGNVQGGMGVDSGDYDNDGRLDLIVTTYAGQQTSLYHNDGGEVFSYSSGTSGLGPSTVPYVTFGVALADLDNDGWLDVIATNGHVRDNVDKIDAAQSYRQPLQAFQNMRGQFTDVSKSSGLSAINMVGRGLTVGDFNRDGRLDVLVCDLEGRAVLLENRSAVGRWLDVRVQDSGPNRFGLGATLRLTGGGPAGIHQVQEIRTSTSVMASREPVAHFGLGNALGPLDLSIRWPDGKLQTVRVDRVDRAITIHRR